METSPLPIFIPLEPKYLPEDTVFKHRELALNVENKLDVFRKNLPMNNTLKMILDPRNNCETVDYLQRRLLHDDWAQLIISVSQGCGSIHMFITCKILMINLASVGFAMI